MDDWTTLADEDGAKASQSEESSESRTLPDVPMRPTTTRLPDPLIALLKRECELQGYDAMAPLIRDTLSAYVGFMAAWRIASPEGDLIPLDEFTRLMADFHRSRETES